MARYELPDDSCALIQPLLPAAPATPRAGHPWAEHRLIINGMFWGLCSSAPWRDLPERYGPWKTVYNRFNRWSMPEIINIIFNKLPSPLDAHGLIDWSATALNIMLSPGQAHESQFAQRLLDGIGVQRQNGSMKRRGHAVLADKAYSGYALRNELKNKGIKIVIPRKSNEKKGRQMVVRSWIVMRTAIATLLNVALVA